MKKIIALALFSSLGMMAQEKVKFSVTINNKLSDTVKIVGQNFNKVLVSKTNSFKDTFEAPKGFYQLSNGQEATSLYLYPGADVTMKLNAKEFDETIVYTGKGSKENNVLAWLNLEQEKLMPAIQSGDQAKIKSTVDGLLSGVKTKLEDKEIDNDFRTQLTAGLSQLEAQVGQMVAQQNAAAKMNGLEAMNFEYENFKGGKTKLSDLRGKYVYIDVWATWCGPCRVEIPHLKKVEAKYHGKNIEFVSISVDEPKAYEKWKKMVADQNLGGVQLIADKNWGSEFIQSFGINGIPRFILIDPAGKVVNSDAPRPSDPTLITLLDGLVK